MLYIDEETMKRTVSMKDMIDGIVEAYKLYEQKAFMMPTRTQIQQDDNTLLLMPCLTDDYIATKLVTVFPANKDIPTIHGLVVLNCNHTGKIKALIDGTYLTGARTGAIGGSAVRYLAKKNASTLAVIGAGIQGFFQSMAACEEREIKNVLIYNRSKGKKLDNFVTRLKEALNSRINVTAVDTVEEAISEADIIITATNSNDPVLPDDEKILTGKLVVGVGSFQPTMREFPESLFKIASRIFVDTNDAIEESGDIVVPLEKGWITRNIVQTITSFISNKDTFAEDETIIFKSTGSALFDSVTASIVYEKALKENVGLTLD